MTESTPAKTGYNASENADAELIYHIFSITKEGYLNYTRFRETIPGSDVKDLVRPTIPPAGAAGVYRTTLARDVESVYCEPSSTAAICPISIRINCRMPRGNTLRSETTVGNPNVALKERNTIGGW
jgi:hypothetical protein